MIAVAGEALMDLIVDPLGHIEARPGGGPFNVARTIARLGQPARRVSGNGPVADGDPRQPDIHVLYFDHVERSPSGGALGDVCPAQR